MKEENMDEFIYNIEDERAFLLEAEHKFQKP